MPLGLSLNARERVQSSPLTILYVILALGVVVSTTVELFYFHSYAAFTPASSSFNVWMDSVRYLGNALPDPYFCNNASYDWNLTASQAMSVGNDVSMHSIGCGVLPDGLALPLEMSNFGVVLMYGMNGRLFFDKGVPFVRTLGRHSIMGADGKMHTDPPTTLHRPDGSLYKAFPNGVVNMTFHELLDAVEVDLDGFSSGEGFARNLPRARYRLTGVDITAHAEHSNLRAGSLVNEYRTKITLSVAPQWAMFSNAMYLNSSVSRFGVNVKIVPGGAVGRFSYSAVLATVVNFFVLLAAAKACVDVLVRLVRFVDPTFGRSDDDAKRADGDDGSDSSTPSSSSVAVPMKCSADADEASDAAKGEDEKVLVNVGPAQGNEDQQLQDV